MDADRRTAPDMSLYKRKGHDPERTPEKRHRPGAGGRHHPSVGPVVQLDPGGTGTRGAAAAAISRPGRSRSKHSNGRRT